MRYIGTSRPSVPIATYNSSASSNNYQIGFFFRVTKDLIDRNPPYSSRVYMDSSPSFSGCKFFQFRMDKWTNATDNSHTENLLRLQSACFTHDLGGLLSFNGHYFRVGSWIQLFLKVLNDGNQ